VFIFDFFKRIVDSIGQRQMTSFIFVLLTIGATILGKTPDDLLSLITQLAAPLAAIGGIFYYLLQTINKRVSDPDDPFEPGDLWALFKSSEFVSALVLSVLSLAPMIGIQIGDQQKDLIVTLALNVISLIVGVPLIKSYASRQSQKLPPEALPMETELPLMEQAP
jgi:hypothetical protein